MLRTKYESVIVDVGGHDTASLRAALTVADMLIVPVLPATFDMWSLEPLHDLIQEAEEINSDLRVLAFPECGGCTRRDNAEAAMIIREKAGFEYFPHPIIRRKAFRNAAAAGLWVMEYRPSDEKAISEFTLLAEHIVRYTGDIASISHAHRKESGPKDKEQRQASSEVYLGCVRSNIESRRRCAFYPDTDPVPKELLDRIDWAAKKRGLNRSSWLRYAATRELDKEEQ